MPEDDLRVPGGVHTDQPDAVICADADEGTHQVARLDWPAGRGSEHQAGVSPGRTEPGTVSGLTFLPGSEGIPGKADERKVTAPSSFLERTDPKLPLSPLDLLADMNRPRVQVDVLPAQAEGFPRRASRTEAGARRPD